jgi:hypothetical protein
LVFDLHKFYLSTLRPENKKLHLAEVISWIYTYFTTQYGISNFVRFTGEVEQPPVPVAVPVAARTVTSENGSLTVTINTDILDNGAIAPVSPSRNDVVEAV